MNLIKTLFCLPASSTTVENGSTTTAKVTVTDNLPPPAQRSSSTSRTDVVSAEPAIRSVRKCLTSYRPRLFGATVNGVSVPCVFLNFIQLLFGLPATSTAVSNIDGGIATTMPTTETSQPASTALPAGSHHQAADDGMPGHSAPVHNVMYFGM